MIDVNDNSNANGNGALDRKVPIKGTIKTKEIKRRTRTQLRSGKRKRTVRRSPTKS